METKDEVIDYMKQYLAQGNVLDYIELAYDAAEMFDLYEEDNECQEVLPYWLINAAEDLFYGK